MRGVEEGHGSMTIRQKLQRERSRIVLLGLVAVCLLLVAVAAGRNESEALGIAVAGSLVFFVAVYQWIFGLRCPRCGHRLGFGLGRGRSTSGAHGPAGRCPSCGAELDGESPE